MSEIFPARFIAPNAGQRDPDDSSPVLPFHSHPRVSRVSPLIFVSDPTESGSKFFSLNDRDRERSSLRIRAAFSRVRRFQRLLALASCNPATFVGLKDRHESRRRARRSQGRLARPKSRNHATSTCPTRLFSPRLCLLKSID